MDRRTRAMTHRAGWGVWAVALGGALAAGAALPAGAGAQGGLSPDPYAMGAPLVRLYYPATGSFSPNIPARALPFNTVIGEGWARNPSSSLLVQVPVRGQRNSFAGQRRVRLVAQELPRGGRPRTLLRRTERIGLIGPLGNARIGFFVYGTGCERLRVRAELLGQGRVLRRARVVPFACGE